VSQNTTLNKKNKVNHYIKEKTYEPVDLYKRTDL